MSIEELVRQNYVKLNENDIYIWQYIDAHRQECATATIEELATKCNVSHTTILRFAKKLDMSGFSELKVQLRMEEKQASLIQSDMLGRVCSDYKKRIDEMEKTDYSEVCEMIRQAKRVFVYGTGAVQSFVAKELKRAFLSAKVCIVDIDGSVSEQEMVTDLLTKDDLVIVVSLSGESKHVVNFARALHLKGVPSLSMTRLKHNMLSTLTDANIYISTSTVNSHIRSYETTALFFVTVEMLLIKYLLYIDQII